MSSNHTNALPPSTKLMNYRIEQVLGQGGFGITYLAHDEALDQKVALKEYFPNSLASRDSSSTRVLINSENDKELFVWGLERFLEETRILAKLSHPNIVRVLNFLEENQTGYMIMQFEEGDILQNWLQRFPDGRPSQKEIFSFLSPLLDALKLVHDNGIMHRDIKPDNIYMRKRDSSPVLLDFGAARSAIGGKSQTLAAIVSAGYSPIEQYGDISGQGPWTDIYALGAVLYNIVTGTKPVEAPSRITASHSGSHDPLEKLSSGSYPGFDEEFLQAINWALELNAKDRPQTIEQWKACFSSFSEFNSEIESTTIPLSTSSDSLHEATEPVHQLNTQTEQDTSPFTESGFGEPKKTPAFNKQSSTHIPANNLSDPALTGFMNKNAKLEPTGRGSYNIVNTLAVIFAAAIGLAVAYYGILYWNKDSIGGDQRTALFLGSLSNVAQTVTDSIDNKDKDVIKFDINNSSELKITANTQPSGMKLSLTDNSNNTVPLFRDENSYIATVSQGTMYLNISSDSVLIQGYDLSISSTPKDVSLTPRRTRQAALNLDKIGWSKEKKKNKITTSYRVLPGQKELFYSFDVNKKSKITIVAGAQSGSGRITLANANENEIRSLDLNTGQRKNIISHLLPGKYYIIPSTNEDITFKYNLSIYGAESIQITPEVDTKQYTAAAKVTLGENLDREEALLAVRTLARIRLVAEARNYLSRIPEESSSLSEIVSLMSEFSNGFPYQEQWGRESWENNGQTLAISLTARYAKVRNSGSVSANLTSTLVNADEPLIFDIKANSNLYLGVFVWQADGNVVRIRPNSSESFTLIKGDTFKINEKDGLKSFPMPGKIASSEAIFITTCETQDSYAQVAPTIESISVQLAAQTGRSTSEFFEKLNSACPQQAQSIQVLPYVVKSKL